MSELKFYKQILKNGETQYFSGMIAICVTKQNQLEEITKDQFYEEAYEKQDSLVKPLKIKPLK
jgi:hypothetical protein